jgi:hypothetical protein
MLASLKRIAERSNMSLSLAIASIVTADLALIALLAFVMSRAGRLTPHLSAVGAGAQAQRLHVVSKDEPRRARSADSLPLAA